MRAYLVVFSRSQIRIVSDSSIRSRHRPSPALPFPFFPSSPRIRGFFPVLCHPIPGESFDLKFQRSHMSSCPGHQGSACPATDRHRRRVTECRSLGSPAGGPNLPQLTHRERVQESVHCGLQSCSVTAMGAGRATERRQLMAPA